MKTIFMKEFLIISSCGSTLIKLVVLLALNRKIDGSHQVFKTGNTYYWSPSQ